jgi:hypothetical protein
MKLEKLTELRPIPEREYVEAYIKAYYLPEDQLETWVKDHKVTLVFPLGHPSLFSP